ncbi:protein kinase [Streptomyces finlayi]|uniref:Protein kinase n=1 Tax=Streptomyces finlayi TaxID=67296 RepID=A0A7G7BJK3_9ACTN|nr:protein kinase [Streptomyces finlayi]QNE75518.1 protein kinase [Streptomyces finlayi]
MDDYAGRVLADRYRLPLPPSDAYELVETRAFDTYSGQEVLVRQVPLPEVVEAEVLDDGRDPRAFRADGPPPAARLATGRTVRRSTDPAVRRAIEAAQAAAQVPDHPRLDQVFDVFAEEGSLWIVSELVEARPLAALLAERPLNPYRAAEIGSDVLTALAVLHAHGWTHRNITVRTVLICDDGRVVLTGLAAGAAEEALCGYVPAPRTDDEDGYAAPAVESGPTGPYVPPAGPATDPYRPRPAAGVPASRPPAALDAPPFGPAPSAADGQELVPRPAHPAVPVPAPVAEPGAGSAAQLRAARAGAIAAYRAGARAAGRVGEEQGGEEDGRDALPGRRPPAERPLLPGAWSSTAEDPYDDEDDDEDDGDRGGDGGRDGGRDEPPGRRVHLAGTWDDGPGSGRPVPAGGSGEDSLRADSRRLGGAQGPGHGNPQERRPLPGGAPLGSWEEVVAGSGSSAPAYRGPATPLAAERARQARIAVVGAVTERWAPEQAGPVHENWQLAPPIGPSTDLWALGALLYRAVQGHAPYPEENAAELVQMVCGEPPAFAEECGALRPVVESLLRQDPAERPEFEELRGWLRSLVRSAPEPEAGTDVVTLPSPDDTRLPVVRRRGELVRRRRGRSGGSAHGRHRQGKQKQRYEQPRYDTTRREPRLPREPKGPKVLRTPSPRRDDGQSPRRLGRLLLVLILFAMAAAVAYALMFMPKTGPDEDTGTRGTPSGSAAPSEPDSRPPSGEASEPAGSQQPQTSRSAVALAPGYVLRKDAEGFEIGTPKDWRRSPANADRQVRYGSDGFSLLIVPGRDTVKVNGGDPLDYQRDKEPELQPFRESSWSSSTGLRRIDVGQQVMAEGQFTWQESGGREVYVRNLVMIVDGRYHTVQVIGPENERDRVTEIYEQAIASYRVAP